MTKMRLPGLKSARRLRAEFGFLLAEFRRQRLAKIVSLDYGGGSQPRFPRHEDWGNASANRSLPAAN